MKPVTWRTVWATAVPIMAGLGVESWLLTGSPWLGVVTGLAGFLLGVIVVWAVERSTRRLPPTR